MTGQPIRHYAEHNIPAYLIEPGTRVSSTLKSPYDATVTRSYFTDTDLVVEFVDDRGQAGKHTHPVRIVGSTA